MKTVGDFRITAKQTLKNSLADLKPSYQVIGRWNGIAGLHLCKDGDLHLNKKRAQFTMRSCECMWSF